MSDEMKKFEIVDEEELENASGGIIFNASRIDGADKNLPFEILNDKNGNVIARASSYDEARRKLEDKGSPLYGLASSEYTEDWNRVCDLRNNPRY